MPIPHPKGRGNRAFPFLRFYWPCLVVWSHLAGCKGAREIMSFFLKETHFPFYYFGKWGSEQSWSWSVFSENLRMIQILEKMTVVISWSCIRHSIMVMKDPKKVHENIVSRDIGQAECWKRWWVGTVYSHVLLCRVQGNWLTETCSQRWGWDCLRPDIGESGLDTSGYSRRDAPREVWPAERPQKRVEPQRPARLSEFKFTCLQGFIDSNFTSLF